MEKFVRVNEISQCLTVSQATIWRWVAQGTFPQPIKLSTRVTVWRKTELDDFFTKK